MDALKSTSSVHEINAEKPPFGSRFLTDQEDVWSHNAWDHVPPPDDQGDLIAASITKQRATPVSVAEKMKYNEKPAKYWDNFYKANAANFFRNRKWLHNEFNELVAATQPQAGPMTIVEIGCGAGNSVFPLLSANKNSQLSLYAYDYSNHAVKLVQNNPLYQSPPLGSIQASVWDVTSTDGLPPGIQPSTVDIVILVFVLSALHPDEWHQAITNIHQILKPNGLVMLRDYGRHDLTQLRFKSGRLLDDNFYIRGDKTRVYFFELDELALIFTGSKVAPTQTITHTQMHAMDEGEDDSLRYEDLSSPGSSTPADDTQTQAESQTLTSTPILGLTPYPNSSIHPNLLSPPTASSPYPLFTIEQLGVDRRLIVNRKRRLKMYRVWMQGKFRKNASLSPPQ
ncbi:hypothetical protein AMATHDRAFT_4121 [Amanita thiersii Skay4041]|uniref:tRNA N(3)-methylcytidine methyltransferase n=1 Tax=Amanita thiersii Skay4041 TaxID=703135 RepID=A0A2A9NLV5_9AGAR|nr:hypothetical protein AMATHDRAFT_4121 [Amanita thiersii Skay4041]